MTVQKIKSGRIPGLDADNFVGDNGQLFFNEGLGDLRLGDGVTPGGIPLSVGGGGGGGYILPTASTTVKGGVKVDGTTITISNQIISVGTVPYSNLSGTPTIPSNTNQLTNGAGFITSSALTGYATETFVTTRGYLTTVGWNDVTGKPTFATVATSGSYNDLTNKPTLFSGSYNDLTNKPILFSGAYADLTGKPTLFSGSYNDLTNKPTIPTDINQLTDTSGLLGQGGGGTTYITNNVENPYTFSVAGDDSTLREISNGETLRFAGATGITITSDAEGKITITGPDLSSYATQSFVTSQGYITNSALTGYATETYVTTRGYLTSVDYSIITGKPTLFSGSWNDLTDKPNLAGTYSFNVAADDSTVREISSEETIKFIGASGITTSSDTEGNITITGPNLSAYALTSSVPTNTNQLINGAGYITSSALVGYATESYVTTRGYLTTVSWNDLTDKPNLVGTYSWSIAADDSTQRQVNSDNLIKIIGGTGISTSSDADGNITITATSAVTDRLTSGSNQAVLNSNGTFSLPMLTADPTGKSAGQVALADGVLWDPLNKNESKPYLALYSGTSWIEIGGLTTSEVYQQILELG